MLYLMDSTVSKFLLESIHSLKCKLRSLTRMGRLLFWVTCVANAVAKYGRSIMAGLSRIAPPSSLAQTKTRTYLVHAQIGNILGRVNSLLRKLHRVTARPCGPQSFNSEHENYYIISVIACIAIRIIFSITIPLQDNQK